MDNHSTLDFKVNREQKTIRISREFSASLHLVWRTWTEAELLDQWWGPEPYRAETKTMDFKEGGYWLYAMVSPEGEKHYARTNFIRIRKEQYFSAKGGFSDEAGNINPDFPQNLWENTFVPLGQTVRVDILLTYDSLTDLEQEIQMGFIEGITIDFQQLDRLLAGMSGHA